MRFVRFLCGLLSICGFLVIAAAMAANTVIPQITKTVPLIVQTPSMLPVISPGDIVLVDPAQAEHVRKGDIVTYAAASGSDKTVTHRVVDKTIMNGTTMLTTKGDHNQVSDTPIKAEQVRGKVVHVIPYAGLLLADRMKMLAIIAASLVLGILALTGRSRTQEERTTTATKHPVVTTPAPTRTQELPWA